jgi:hypothetical protein
MTSESLKSPFNLEQSQTTTTKQALFLKFSLPLKPYLGASKISSSPRLAFNGYGLLMRTRPSLSAVKLTEEAGFKFNLQLKPYLRGEQDQLKPPFSFNCYGPLMRQASLSAKSDGHSRDP